MSKNKSCPFPSQSKDLPATQGMLKLVRDELRHEMRSGFKKIEARFAEQDSKFAAIDSRFASIDSRFATHDAKFEQILSEIARVGVLVEEQNSRNRVALEGLTGLWQRQDRLESRMDQCESLVRSITRSRSPAE